MNASEQSTQQLTLIGKIEIRGVIECITGLHIGGAKEKVEIGGIDNPVIRDPLTDLPYIPGSSLKGAMRSKLELFNSLSLKVVKQGSPPIRMHECNDNSCIHCIIFGKPASANGNMPTALYVYDAFPTEETKELWNKLEDYIEIKYENQLDRITSAANPRLIERVPAGSKFDFMMIYNVYDVNKNNIGEALRYIFTGLMLIEDEYLGGYGSRGSGRVKFTNISIHLKKRSYYETGKSDQLQLTPKADKADKAVNVNVSYILENIENIKAEVEKGLNSK